MENVFVLIMIFTVNLVWLVVHAAVVDVIAHQFSRNTVGRVPTLEFRWIVAAGNILKSDSRSQYISVF